MEDTLRELFFLQNISLTSVLILVLMEDTLRDYFSVNNTDIFIVLILVLMEDTLREASIALKSLYVCLNPCFNGRYSQS